MRVLKLEKGDLPNDSSWILKLGLYEFTPSSLSALFCCWDGGRRELNEEKHKTENWLGWSKMQNVISK